MEQDYRAPVVEQDRIRAALVSDMIGLSLDVTLEAMTAGTGLGARPGASLGARLGARLGLRACRARWLSLYLAHVGYGWPLDRVAYAFGVNRATAGKGCRWAEDARDDPDVDALLDRLEQILRDLCDAPRTDLAALELAA